MIRALSRPRLTRVQFVIVATLSAAATALIIIAATGPSDAKSAALAALHRHQVVVSSGGGPRTGAATEASLTPGVTPAGGAASGAGQSSTGGGSSGSGAAGGGSVPTTTTTTTTPAPTPKPKTAPVDHVFVIALSSTSWDATFGPGSAAHYLNDKLKSEGTELGGYESLGGAGLPDYLATISGQPPNADTRLGCPTYAEFDSSVKPSADGVVSSAGCVYPNTVLTIGDQVTSSGHVWRAYIDDLGSTACPHPNSNAADDAPLPGTGPEYASRHNPFVYFHSLLDLGGCASNDVALTQLPHDLAKSSATPTFAYLAPNACADAGATSCPGGGPAGIAAEDAFLKEWVPRITSSAAYKKGGALVITFAPPTGTPGTAPSPDSAIPTGALVLSPFTPRNQIVSAVYNPYSVLRTIEDLLGYKPLGLAAKAKSFAGKAFSS